MLNANRKFKMGDRVLWSGDFDPAGNFVHDDGREQARILANPPDGPCRMVPVRDGYVRLADIETAPEFDPDSCRVVDVQPESRPTLPIGLDFRALFLEACAILGLYEMGPDSSGSSPACYCSECGAERKSDDVARSWHLEDCRLAAMLRISDEVEREKYRDHGPGFCEALFHPSPELVENFASGDREPEPGTLFGKPVVRVPSK